LVLGRDLMLQAPFTSIKTGISVKLIVILILALEMDHCQSLENAFLP
jgi:hypothetical protein